eukprot:1245779-Rhodomonas_salina.1
MLTCDACKQVVRVFNSLQALKTIIHALTSAIIPVSNAFAVLAVATAIYAVIGVGLYEEVDPVQFGDFKRAIFTVLVPFARCLPWACHGGATLVLPVLAAMS